MATFNPRKDLLNKQIASIRAQTVTDWECLVLDDGSQDREVVASALAGDDRFTLLPAATNRGPYLAFETLLSRVPNNLPVFLCDQDDVWDPRKLERMLECDGTVFSAMRVTNETGRVVRERFLANPPSPHALTPAGILLMNSVSGAALMLSPDVLATALPFPAPQLRGWHDQWLGAVAARLGRLHYLDEPLVDYTRHTAQVTGEGVRRLTNRGVQGYVSRIRANGLRADLTGRAQWIVLAARRLLEMDDAPDAELAALASGHFLRPVSRSTLARETPVSRAALLVAGGVLRGLQH